MPDYTETLVDKLRRESKQPARAEWNRYSGISFGSNQNAGHGTSTTVAVSPSVETKPTETTPVTTEPSTATPVTTPPPATEQTTTPPAPSPAVTPSPVKQSPVFNVEPMDEKLMKQFNLGGRLQELRQSKDPFLEQTPTEPVQPEVTEPEEDLDPYDAFIREQEQKGEDQQNLWRNYIKYLQQQDEEAQKQEKRETMWDTMARGITGALNLAGTMQGAPDMHIQNAERKNDAYSRLTDDRELITKLINQRMSQMQSEREQNRKLLTDRYNYQLKVKRLESTIAAKERELAIKEKQAGQKEPTEQLRAEILDLKKQKAQMDIDYEPTKQALDRRVKESQISRNNRSNQGEKKTDSGSKLTSKNGNVYNFGSNPDWVGIAESMGAKLGSRNRTEDAKKWIRENVDDESYDFSPFIKN